MARWLAALCGISFLLVCYAEAAEPVGSLRPKPNCDHNYSDCSNVIQVYTTIEVDQRIEGVASSSRRCDQDLSDLKAIVEAQSQQIAELRKKAGLR